MAFIPDLEAAANRHYEDACTLQSARRFDNAGYHFGLAAECAIKKKLRDFGTPMDDPSIWKHWPELKGLASIALQGRQAAQARKLVEHDSFMQRWHIAMRYSANGTVGAMEAERWKEHANQALGLLL
jgi:hypothetical protein